MMKRGTLMIILCLALLVSLAACNVDQNASTGNSSSGSGGATGNGGVISGGGATPGDTGATPAGSGSGEVIVAGTAEVSTALPSTGELVTPTPAGPMAVTPGQPLSVTLADRGRTVNLKVDETFLLNLGEGFTWSPVVADQSIVRRVPNIMVIRGAQGIYKAHAPGTTTLNATGDPACRQTKPPCMMPSLLFTITLVVTQ